MKKIDISQINDYSCICSIDNIKLENYLLNNAKYNAYSDGSNNEIISFNKDSSLLYEFNRFIYEQFAVYEYYIKKLDPNEVDKEYCEFLFNESINMNNDDIVFNYIDKLLHNQKLLYFDRQKPDDKFENVSLSNMYIIRSMNKEEASEVLYDYCIDKNLKNYPLVKKYIEKKKEKKENDELNNSGNMNRK